MTLYRNGRKAEDLSGSTLAFGTAKGETVVVAPKGTAPGTVKVATTIPKRMVSS